MVRRCLLFPTLTAAVLLLAGGCAESAGQTEGEDFPGGQGVTIIVAAGPGGGTDTLARQVESAFTEEDVISAGIEVVNVDGGAGVPGRASMRSKEDQGRTVVVDGNRIYMAYLTGQDATSMDAYTPVAKLTSDYIVWAVRADSEWKSAEDLLDALVQDPKAVSIGVGSIPGNDYFNIIGPAQEKGIDPAEMNIVAFDAGGEVKTNLLGGHVDVVSTSASEIADQVAAGEVRLLSTSGEDRLQGELSDVPTWQEIGVDFSLTHWRGLFGPADMTDEAIAWWDESLSAMIKTDTWNESVADQGLETTYENSAEFTKSLQPEMERNREFLELIGLLKVDE